jgi:uncharacterized protein (DUF1501 family)
MDVTRSLRASVRAVDLSRRAFLGQGLSGLGLSGLGLSGLGLAGASPLARLLAAPAGAPAAGETFVVVVNMRGGCDGLNLAVPFRLANYTQLRPTIGITQAQGISLATGPFPNADYLLHPAFAQLGARYAQGQLAIANLVGYPDADLSHAESMEIWSRGVRRPSTPGTQGGWLARYKDGYARQDLGVIGMNTGRILDFEGGETSPLVLGSLSSFGFAEDPRFPVHSRYRNQVVRDMATAAPGEGQSAEVKAALEQAYGQIERIQSVVGTYASAVTYPTSSLGRSLRDVAMLVQADVGVRAFYVATGGFDTHSNQGGATGQQAGLFAGIDQAVGAFCTDLDAMGAMNRCVIVVISEFGRRNDENGGRGTDHGSSNCVLMLGGAVRGGVYGRPHDETDLVEGHTPYAIDFRSIYKEILERHLGADPAPVFPESYPNDQRLGFVL